IESLGAMLDDAFKQAEGEIFKTLRESEKDAFEKATIAGATGEQFAGQLKAYRAAPKIYMHEQQMATFEEALDGIRKYVVVAEPNDIQTTIIDLQEKLAPSLYQLGGIQESSEQ
ncbi:MAG: hypothetical protein JSW66_09945, partial [Phycisphaerales bacterium]